MIDKIQTLGQASRGIVYVIIGALTALTAFDLGGQKTRKFGCMARGVVFGIIGYFLIQAAATGNASVMKSTQDVFSYLQDFSCGWLIMGVVAIGLLRHGIFMMLIAQNSYIRK